MKQAIIFGILISIFTLFCVTLFNTIYYGNYVSTTFEVVQDGEIIYTTPLTPHVNKVVWYVSEDDGTELILEDYQILYYYGFSQTYDSLSNPANIDWETIYNKSGETAEINMFYIQGTDVTMYEANCQNKQCLRAGTISKPGQSIVCAPHKLVGQINGDGGDVDA